MSLSLQFILISIFHTGFNLQTLISGFYRKNAVITSISPATAVIERESAPKMAYFSSKGPNHVAPDIIKVKFLFVLVYRLTIFFLLLQPDITAPGVNVYSALLPPSGVADNAVVYGYTSGTSIAAPHVAGFVSVLRAINKRWECFGYKISTNDNG